MHDGDPGERLLSAMEKATRLRQVTCPWQAMRDPFTVAVIEAHRWWKEHQLDARYGGAIPEAIRRGIDVYESALNSVIAHDREIEQQRREAEAAEQPGSRGSRLPIPRRR